MESQTPVNLIGRQNETGMIGRHIERTIAGKEGPNVIFITGEAGMGKSTLLKWTREHAMLMPARPVAAISDCSTPLAGRDIGELEALQPWVEIMAALSVGQPQQAHDTRKLISNLAMAWVHCIPVVGDVLESVIDTATIIKGYSSGAGAKPAVQAAGSQEQLFQQYINFLGTLSESVPLILMIDDFHWADTSSTNLLFAAARGLQGKRVLFPVAYRPDDALSSRGGEGHPLIHVRNELERYGLAEEVGVPKMTPADLDALLRDRYHNYVNNDAFEEWIASVSGGNALFITQFLHTLEEDGLIDPTEGKISEGYRSIPIPRTAYAVMQERIRRLGDESGELLRYASVEGETFTAMVLSKTTETPQLKLLQKLRIIEEKNRVIQSLGKQRLYAKESTAYQFSHPLLHDAMYNSLGEEERELLHEAILDVLKEEWETAIEDGEMIATLAARLARHAEVLKQHRFAAEVLLVSAQSSWREHAAEEVLRLTDEMLVSLGHLKPKQIDSGVEKLRGEAQSLRALVYRRFSRNEEATVAYHEALEAFERGGASDRVVDLLNGASRIPWREGRYDEAEVAMRDALAKAEAIDYKLGQASAHANLASLYYRLARYGEAIEESMKSLGLYRALGNTSGESTVLTTLGNVYYKSGDFGRSLEYQKESLALKEKDGDMLGQAASLGNLGLIHARQGDFGSSLDFMMRGMEIFDRVGDRHELAVALGNVGSVHSNLNQKEKALEYFFRALEIRQAIHDRYGEAFSLSDIGAEYLDLGDLEKALEYQVRSYEIRIAIHDRYGEAASLMLIGTIYKNMDEPERARETLEEGLKLATEIGSSLLLAQGYGTLGEVALLERRSLPEAEQGARLQEAIENFNRAIALEPEVGPREVEQWKKMLEEIENGKLRMEN